MVKSHSFTDLLGIIEGKPKEQKKYNKTCRDIFGELEGGQVTTSDFFLINSDSSYILILSYT